MDEYLDGGGGLVARGEEDGDAGVAEVAAEGEEGVVSELGEGVREAVAEVEGELQAGGGDFTIRPC